MSYDDNFVYIEFRTTDKKIRKILYDIKCRHLILMMLLHF